MDENRQFPFFIFGAEPLVNATTVLILSFPRFLLSPPKLLLVLSLPFEGFVRPPPIRKVDLSISALFFFLSR